MTQARDPKEIGFALEGDARTRELLLRKAFSGQPYSADSHTDAFSVIVQDMRSGKYGGVPLSGDAPIAMLAILKSLDWPVSTTQLSGAMPHFPETFDILDVREVLHRLGYQSKRMAYHPKRISASDLPALLADGDRIWVVLATGEGTFRITDPQTGRDVSLKHRAGVEIVSFCKAKTKFEPLQKRSWLGELLGDFRREIALLFGLTFAINLAVLVSSFAVMTIYDKVIPARALDTLIALVGGVAFSVAIEIAFRKLKARLIGQTAGRLEYAMGSAIFSKLISLPTQAVIGSPVGDQIARLKQFESVRDLFSGPFAAIGLELPFVPLFGLCLFLIGGVLGWVPVVFVVVYLVVGLLVIKPIQRYSRKMAAARKEQYQATFETISHMRLLRVIGCEEVWLKRLERLIQASASAKRKANLLQRSLNSISAATIPLAGGATSAIGAALVINGQLTIGMLIGTMIVVWRVLAPIQQMFLLLSRYADISQMVEQVDRLMRLPSESTAATPAVKREFKGRITLDRVSFRYAGSPEPTLQGLSFDIEPGSLIAVEGHSGAGKTTLLRLMLNLYQPQMGTVRIDNLNVQQIPVSELRGGIGYVPQQAALFHGTIAQNLRLANPSASDDCLREISEKLGLLKLIEAMPGGFDTLIDHERNANLAMGFKQALVMAQALLRRPQFLLLDDPAKTLDRDLETALLNVLMDKRGEVTTVMVSHRPSHIRLADRVIVLDRGIMKSFDPPPGAPNHKAA